MEITTIIAIYGAALSTISTIVFLYLRRRDDKVDIRITINKRFNEDPSDGGTATYTILAQNFGKRTGYIDSVQLKLQCEDKEYALRSPKRLMHGFGGEISIPCELLPGNKLETTVDFWEVLKFVEDEFKYREINYLANDPPHQNHNLYRGKLPLEKCKLIAYFEDQLGTIRKSKPVNI